MKFTRCLRNLRSVCPRHCQALVGALILTVLFPSMRAKAAFYWTNNNGVNNNPEIVVGSTTVGTGTNIDAVSTTQGTISITLSAGSSILTSVNAISNTNVGATNTITNLGTITTSASGLYIDGSAAITNPGTIEATGSFGIFVNGNATLNNTGTITDSGGGAYEAVRIYGTSTITNLGTISGTVYGIGIGANSTLTNYGIVGGPSDSVYYNGASGTVIVETNSQFNGTIQGAGAANAKLEFNIEGLSSSQQTLFTDYLNTHGAAGTYTLGGDTYTWAGFGSGTVSFTAASTIYSFATISGLNANERGIASSIDTGSNGNSSAIGHITTTLSSLPTTSVAGALDELAPTKFNQFASSTAFNNATFAVADMDNYLDGERTGPNGTFASGNGQVDTRNFVIQDANVDPGLQMIHSRMLAWNDLPHTITDVPGAVLGGIDMKDPKQMKFCPACTASSPWNVFLRGSVVLAQDFSQADVPHSDNNTVAITAGADYRLTEHLLVGATMSYAHTDATLDDSGSSATVDSYSPGIYASYADGGWFANFIGRYSYNSYTENRNIAFLGQTANGGTEGNEGMIDLDGGYLFHSGQWSYGPVAGIQYTHLSVDGYTEQDSDANLTVQEDQSDSLRGRLGGEVRFDTCGCGVTFSPHLTATWQHEFLDQSRGLTSSFTQFSGGSFTVRTDNPSRDSALVDLGLDAKVASSVTVFGDYVVQAGQSNYFGQSLQAGVRVNF